MRLFLSTLLAAFVLSTSFATGAYALTASVEADGFSFSLAPTGTSAGFDLFFTSYDGFSGLPLLDCTGGPCFTDGYANPNTRTERVNGSGIGNCHARASVPAASEFLGAVTGIPGPIPQTEGARFDVVRNCCQWVRIWMGK